MNLECSNCSCRCERQIQVLHIRNATPPTHTHTLFICYNCFPEVGKTFLSGFHLHLQTVTGLINPQWRHVDKSSRFSCNIIVLARLNLGVILAVTEGWVGCGWEGMPELVLLSRSPLDIKCACLLLVVILFLSLLQVTPELLEPHLLNIAWADSVCFQCFNVCQADLAQAALIPLVIWCRTLLWLLTRV